MDLTAIEVCLVTGYSLVEVFHQLNFLTADY